MEEKKSLFLYVTNYENRDKAPVTDQWRCGKWGAVVVRKEASDYQARFVGFDYNKHAGLLVEGDGRAFNVTEAKFNSSEIVAAGIIGYWLYHRGKKDIPEIISDYYEFQKENYIEQQSATRGEGKAVYEREFVCEEFQVEEVTRRAECNGFCGYFNQAEVNRFDVLFSDCLFYADKQIERYYPDYFLDHPNTARARRIGGSMLQNVSQSSGSGYSLDYQVWHNCRGGVIVDRKDGVYRFVEVDLDDLDSGKEDAHTLMAGDRFRSCPIVACGFVGYLLKERVGEADAETLYRGYYNKLFEQYKAERLKLPKSRKECLERDFSAKHVSEEERRIEASRALLDYLPPQDQELIEDFMDDYMEFAREQRDLYSAEHPYKTITQTFDSRWWSKEEDEAFFRRVVEQALRRRELEKNPTEETPQSANVVNINIQTSNVNLKGPSADDEVQPEVTEGQMKAAVEQCLADFGSGRAWAVVYRVWMIHGFKDDFKKFETMVRSWGFEKRSKPLNYSSCMKRDFQSRLEGSPDDWERRGEKDFAKLGKKLEELLGLRNVSDG